ncbi:MAG: hypothetical protein O7I42_11500, partial [Alphaproteobacteria bacterium]|nr:hypothetical protein [Alphaproteobacteria bacterium]
MGYKLALILLSLVLASCGTEGPARMHTVDVVTDDGALAFGQHQNLGLLHPENLIRSGCPSENIIFSDLPEVDPKVKPKVSAGLGGNLSADATVSSR